jgi:hypothetical protein
LRLVASEQLAARLEVSITLDVPNLRRLLEDILPQNSFFNDLEVTREFERIGPRTTLLNARRLDTEEGAPEPDRDARLPSNSSFELLSSVADQVVTDVSFARLRCALGW